MRAAVLFSGGKDSTLALYEALRKGYDVKYLLTVFPESKESYMFHYPNIEITRKQAKSAGIPLKTGDTKGEKEKELEDLERLIESVKNEIDTIVSGAIASEYQKSRVDKICDKFKLKSFAPLWKRDPLILWKTCLDNGFKVMITSVACEGLGKEWLGRMITSDNFEELKKLSKRYRFHIGGEGGEFETLVLDCPVFKKRINVVKARKDWHDDSGVYEIEKARSIEK